MRPRVESIAARLLAATGANEVRRIDCRDGVRLEVDIPVGLSEDDRSFLVSALAAADN